METKTAQQDEEEIFEFDFGHKTFQFKRTWLIYYPWLSSLFGLSNEESKHAFKQINKLSHNLTVYLSNLKPIYIRRLINALNTIVYEFMNNSVALEDVRFIQNEELRILKIQLEDFLCHGPGNIKGIDIEYCCKLCNKKTFDITIVTEPPKTCRKILPHKFENITSSRKACVLCGMIWGHETDIYVGSRVCISNLEFCNHEWE